MSIILFIIILGILIFVHELGHFLAAKKFKIRVDEFALGFPPRVWAKKIGETVYALNIVPIGGYVKIYGEDGDDEEAPDKKTEIKPGKKMSDVPRHKQALILASGILGNLIFAWLILSIGFMVGMPTSPGGPFANEIGSQRLVITGVLPNSPAEEAGLKAGDQILKINDKITVGMMIDEAVSLIRGPKGTEVVLTIGRDGWTEAKEFKITRAVIIIPIVKFEMKQAANKPVAYVALYQFTDNSAAEFQKAEVFTARYCLGKVIEL